MLEYKPIWRVPGTVLRSNSLHLQFTIFLQRHESSWLSTYMAKNHQNDYLYRNNAPLSKIITRPWVQFILVSLYLIMWIFFSDLSKKTKVSISPLPPPVFSMSYTWVPCYHGKCGRRWTSREFHGSSPCCKWVRWVLRWSRRTGSPGDHTRVWIRNRADLCLKHKSNDNDWSTDYQHPTMDKNLSLRKYDTCFFFFFNREPRCFSLFILMQRYREMIKNPFHFTKIVKRPDVSSDNAQWGGVVLKPN